MKIRYLSAQLLLLSAACSDPVSRPQGTLQLEVDRPELAAELEVGSYSGSDAFVMEAQAKHHTGLDLHRNVITRTCGPTNGVCHNQKEYPDLHTPSNLLNAVNAPCNVQPGDWSQVFDGCERSGDLFSLGGSNQAELGYIEYVTGDNQEYSDKKRPSKDSPGLHIYLADDVKLSNNGGETWGDAIFSRKVNDNGKVQELARARYQTHWFILDGGKHIFGQVAEYQVDAVTQLLAARLEQGDMNRNGVYGAKSAEPLNLLKAGNPEQSYIIGRLRGELHGSPIPGTRMPLANEPLSVADMLALYCFVEQLPASFDGEYDMMTPIDYANCSYTQNPESLNLLGKGVTWIGRVQPLLKSNCAGCHSGTMPQAGFDVVSMGNYERLLGMSMQNSTMPFITPGDPEKSYLWLKLKGMGVGGGMPLDSSNVFRELPSGAMTDIETWIKNGAKAQE